MLITIKFGGTSVGDADRIRGAAMLVAGVVAQGHRAVVVTSAMSGATNKLVALIEESAAGGGDEAARVATYLRFTKQLEQDHLETARKAIRNAAIVEEVARVLYTERHGLERVLLGSHLLGELTPIGYDFVVSQGERLCAPILAGCLRDLGLDAVSLGGDQAGIVTDNNYGSARPHDERTRQGVRKALLPLVEAGKVPVVTGFYGSSEQGRIATLGRGGSDYSATLIGCALDSDEVWIMTDVDGIRTTDPRLVPAAHTIAEMPYAIAAEMAMLGAKVLHQKSVLPAAKQGTPLRVASSFEPEKPGTRLVPIDPNRPASVSALTLVRRGGLIRVGASDFGTQAVAARALMDDLDRHNVDVLATAFGAGGGSTLWLVGNLDLDRFLTVLKRHQREAGTAQVAAAAAEPRFDADVQRNVAVLGIVGHKVATAAGILADVARCLEKTGAEPLAVLQGASPNSIIIALPDDEQRLPATLRTLHKELGLE